MGSIAGNQSQTLMMLKQKLLLKVHRIYFYLHGIFDNRLCCRKTKPDAQNIILFAMVSSLANCHRHKPEPFSLMEAAAAMQTWSSG